jgi:hypothetical protein
MWKKIKELLKELYLKLSCYMCCRSKCSVQLGREEQTNTQKTSV